MEQSRLWLVVEEGPSPGQRITLEQDALVIGREAGVDVVINSPAVSRRHVCLTHHDSRLLLEDLGSSNGTYLNGVPLNGTAELKPGDRIGLGRAIVLRVAGETQQEPPATRIDSLPALVPDEARQTVIGDALSLAGQPPQLLVTVAGGSPQVHSLTRTRYTLGRTEDNDIVIPSPIVSRHIASIEREPGGYRLTAATGAANPLTLAGRPLIGEHFLRHGDRLQVGGADPGVLVTIEFQVPDTAGAAPPAALDFTGKNLIAIGRDSGNDVVLASPLVSRFHAQFERVGQRYRVVDLRSANGTFVNDRRIESDAWLHTGDTVRIGAQRFVIDQEGVTAVDEPGGLRVEVLNLNKWVRKDLNLLKDISLIFEPREFVVVVGQSGGGKSTLVDAIAGYRPASAGQVLVNGINVYRNFDAIRNEIGFVPQKDIIHMELTIYQALDYAARLRMPADTTRAERHERVLQVLRELDLEHRKDVQISGLSGGQQKRVSIGVELLTQPGLFFLDEPSSGLDPGTETALMQLMRHLADQGRTIVLITHATKNVMLADKVVFLARGGYLAWFGPPDEALEYFNAYRSSRDQAARRMEFDEIYAILDDPSKGTAEAWAQRFSEHPSYQKNVVEPLAATRARLEGGKNKAGGAAPASEMASLASPAPAASPDNAATSKGSKPRRRKVSALRQFAILSSRNLKILTRDRSSLVLMLAVAPLIGMLDVLIANLLGRNPFDINTGRMDDISTSLFLLSVYGVMVGGLAFMREIVKETDIYRRERLVNLRITPYVLSKVWMVLLLGLYHAAAYTIIHFLAFEMPGGFQEMLLIYVSLALATMGGMMVGLFASALAPNANTAPMIVILFMLPQIVLGGVLIAVPDFISAPTSTRWAFQGFMAITGAGADVAGDACWSLPADLRAAMTIDDKTHFGCKCMGINVLNPQSCNYPGVGAFYNPAVDQPRPETPDVLEAPPPEPVLPPPPSEPANQADTVAVAEYLTLLKQYQAEVEIIQADFRAAMDAYQAKAEVFKEKNINFQRELAEWQIARNAAVGTAEGLINASVERLGWSFVNKADRQAYWGVLTKTWSAQGVIIGVLFVAILGLMKRKDQGAK